MNKLRAWDHHNEVMVYSSEECAVFILEKGEWKIKYVREKTLQNGDVEIDAPVWEESDDVEVMLGVGLQDKNKNLIYSGDIVKYDFNWDYEEGWLGAEDKRKFVKETKKHPLYIGQVELHISEYSQFVINGTAKGHQRLNLNPLSMLIEIIGNIHQHQNLLK